MLRFVCAPLQYVTTTRTEIACLRKFRDTNVHVTSVASSPRPFRDGPLAHVCVCRRPSRPMPVLEALLPFHHGTCCPAGRGSRARTFNQVEGTDRVCAQ